MERILTKEDIGKTFWFDGSRKEFGKLVEITEDELSFECVSDETGVYSRYEDGLFYFTSYLEFEEKED